jgi:hypothetical protein
MSRWGLTIPLSGLPLAQHVPPLGHFRRIRGFATVISGEGAANRSEDLSWPEKRDVRSRSCSR